jgi:hypothetical protein
LNKINLAVNDGDGDGGAVVYDGDAGGFSCCS